MPLRSPRDRCELQRTHPPVSPVLRSLAALPGRCLYAFCTALLLAGFTLVAPGVAIAGDAAQPTKEQLGEAKVRFARGKQLFNDGDYKLSLIEFQRAYELAPNFRILFNVGEVNMQLNNYSAALTAFEKYLDDGGKNIPAKRKQQVQDQIQLLRTRTAHVTLTANVDGATVTIDDIAIGTTPLPKSILVDAGQHRISATKEGRLPVSKVVTLAGSDETAVELELPEPPVVMMPAPPSLTPAQPAQPPPIVLVPPPSSGSNVWIGWVATAALAGGAAVTGGLALNASSELKSTLNSQQNLKQADVDSQKSKARSFAIATDVLAGSAIVAGGVSLYFSLKSNKPAQPASSTRLDVGPTSARVTGSF